mmetsp:Transcript_2445/g.4089  ORF Transcript_2445/g.4089 Transcript_2445/m.4089 type:complete len:363 (-) Transcript_2445:289-1377(-)
MARICCLRSATAAWKLAVSVAVALTSRFRCTIFFLSEALVCWSLVILPRAAFFFPWKRTLICSRLSTAVSMAASSRSCSRLRFSSRSFMRWISFSMPLASLMPTSGSSAACVSRSSWIFFSQSITCRSVSTISSSTSALRVRTSCTRASRRRLSPSSSRSSSTNSFSSTKFWFCSSPCALAFCPISSFSRTMSLCITSMEALSRLTSSLCCWISWSWRKRFWLRMLTLAFSSAFFSRSSSVSATVWTRVVWSASHSCCIWSTSFPTDSISFCRCRMVDSKGPMFSTSSMFSVSFSYLRLSRSTRYIFFSISSLRWRISIWYFSMSASLALSSSSSLPSVSRSCTLCASVFRASTLMRAISFW